MKKALYTIVAAAVALFASCNKEQVPNLTLEQEEVTVECKADTVNVKVNCNVGSKAVLTYDQENQKDWILMLPRVLYGDGVLTFFVKEYLGVLADRSATITITAGDEVKVLKVVQKAKDGIELSRLNYTAPKNGGKLTVIVGANTNWTASVTKGADWITVDKGSGPQGENPMELSFAKVSGIGEFDMRVGVVHVTTGPLSEDLYVYQGFGVIINGLRWAERNVGEFRQFSSAPDDIGCMYQYNSNIAYPSSGGAPSDYWTGWTDTGWVQWNPATDPSPEGWRIPTMQEMEDLIGWSTDTPKYVWVNPSASGFALPGVVVGESAEAVAGATAADLKGGIFIPQSGYRHNITAELYDTERACVQTNTTPNEYWDRYVYCMGPNGKADWGKSWGDWEIKACALSAFPIRCCAELPQ